MYDHVQLNGHELSYYNDQKIWCTGHSQTMINAYDFIHSDVPEIDPLGFKENTVNMLLILSQSGDEYYHEHFPELTFYRNGPYSIDTVKKGISKGQVSNVCKRTSAGKSSYFWIWRWSE